MSRVSDVTLLPRRDKKDIVELFGYPARDISPQAREIRKRKGCPFIESRCTKLDHLGQSTGVCSVYNPRENEETVICPNRLYFDGYKVLVDVVQDAFGTGHALIHPKQMRSIRQDGKKIVALGQNFGKEVRVPVPGGGGGKPRRFFYTDWVLAQITAERRLGSYVGVEVQSIDITGNYRAAQAGYLRGSSDPPASGHGLNWENVNKRILPQIIFKGRVLHREKRCERGLYFILPEPVYKRVIARLGGGLEEYPPGRGAVTFLRYSLSPVAIPGAVRPVIHAGTTRTNVESIASRFAGARDLPPAGAFERHIIEALGL